MNSFDQKRSQDCARRIDRALSKAISSEVTDAINLLDNCHDSLVKMACNNFEILEISRRIAEAKISILYERKGACDEFNTAWAKLDSLGYSSLDREASMLVYAIKFFNQVGDKSREINAHKRLDDLITQMLIAGDAVSASHYKSCVTKIST